MFGKGKIRKEFENAYKTGNEDQMNQLIQDNPWLLDEWEAKTEGTDNLMILAALGVMEDEIGGPAPMDEISFCLRVDFKTKMADGEIQQYLEESESLGYARQVQGGWQLTSEGGNKADSYLSSH